MEESPLVDTRGGLEFGCVVGAVGLRQVGSSGGRRRVCWGVGTLLDTNVDDGLWVCPELGEREEIMGGRSPARGGVTCKLLIGDVFVGMRRCW